MKKKPFTYVIDCGNYDSFSSVLFAMREEVKHNAAMLRIMKGKPKIWCKEDICKQINKCNAFFQVYKSVRKHWNETNSFTGL
mgnify:CR=1 FL=1